MRLKLRLWAAKMMQTAIGILAGWIFTYIGACFFHTIFVLKNLESIGAKISIEIYLKTIILNLYGLAFEGVSYASFILIGFLISMLSAVLTCKLLKILPWLIYALAGATSMATILYIGSLNFFGYSFISSAQSTLGFGCQALAGALGGIVFFSIYHRDGLNAG